MHKRHLLSCNVRASCHHAFTLQVNLCNKLQGSIEAQCGVVCRQSAHPVGDLHICIHSITLFLLHTIAAQQGFYVCEMRVKPDTQQAHSPVKEPLLNISTIHASLLGSAAQQQLSRDMTEEFRHWSVMGCIGTG